MSSGKHLEDISHAHIVCLMYKLLTSANDTNDLSIRFDRNRERRQRELTNNKNQKGKYLLRTKLRDIFGFAEHKQKAIFALGYKQALTRASAISALNKDNAINIGKIKIINIKWYASHYTPSVPQQAILSEQIFSKTPTEFQFMERSVFMKEIKTQNFWTFELGTQESINVPIWNYCRFPTKR